MVVNAWADEQAAIGNPAAPRSIAALNLLGKPRDELGMRMRGIILSQLIRLAIGTKPVEYTQNPGGSFWLTKAERARLTGIVSQLVSGLTWGVIVKVRPWLPIGADRMPTGEAGFSIIFLMERAPSQGATAQA